MVSRSMQAKCIFSWTNFLTKFTNMARTGHMLGLYVVLHPLFIFVGVRTIHTNVIPIFTSG